MRTYLIILALGFSLTSIAQNSNPNVSKPKTPIKCDTIRAGTMVVLDSDVVHCSVTIVSGGIIVHQRINEGRFIVETPPLRTGMVVLCEEIVASPRRGLYVKRPARKFVIQ